jgi:hypothetical protein
VVAEREHVGARGQQTVRQPRRQARAVRGVLRVDDAEAGVELLLQARQPLLDRLAAGRPEDIGYEEELQGSDNVAAWISIATWFPAS